MFLAVSPELLLSPQSPAAPKLKSGSAPDAGDDGVVLLYGGLTDGGLTDGGFFGIWTESSIKGGRCAEGIVTTAVIARIAKTAAGKPSLSNVVIRGNIRTSMLIFSNYFNVIVLARKHTSLISCSSYVIAANLKFFQHDVQKNSSPILSCSSVLFVVSYTSLHSTHIVLAITARMFLGNNFP